MNALEAARTILTTNENGADIVSVLVTKGAHAGERLLVERNGSVRGSVGDAQLEGAAVTLAQRVYEEKTPLMDGDLFAELHHAAESLVIFGAGHIAVPLADLGVKLGFAVTVLDDRTDFAEQARFNPQARVQVLDYAQPLAGVRITASTYIVLVTRAHKYDFDCLRAVLHQPVQPHYIGMIGSRRRVRAAFTALLDGGIAQEQLARVHAPVGIDIGAETPAEIAVSIAAELVRVRRGGTAESLASQERVAERFFPEPKA